MKEENYMKFCQKCGKELNDNAVVCVHCGCSTADTGKNGTAVLDAPSFGYGFLGFVIPLVGLVLFLCWKDKTPLRAKSAGIGALISVIIAVVFWIIAGAIFGSLFAYM